MSNENLDIPNFLKEHKKRQAAMRPRSTGDKLADQIVPKAEAAAYDLGDAFDGMKRFFKNCGKFWKSLSGKEKAIVSTVGLLIAGGAGLAIKSNADEYQDHYDRSLAYQRDNGGWKYRDMGDSVKIIFNGGEPEYLRSDAFYSAQKDYRNAKAQVQQAKQILDPK